MAERCSASGLCSVVSCAVLLALVNVAGAAKILVVPSDGNNWVNMKLLMTELIARGHACTMLRPSNAIAMDEESDVFHIEKIQVKEQHTLSREQMEKYFLDFVFSHAFSKRASSLSVALEYLAVNNEVSKITAFLVQNMFENKELIGRLEDARFEVVLADTQYAGGVMLARHLNVPVVLFGRWLQTEDIQFAIAPSPLSYVPVLNSRVTDRMGFLERFRNLVIYSLNEVTNRFFISPPYDELCRRYLKTDTGIYELYRKADIYLIRVDFVLEFPRPTMPNAVYVGGFQCQPPKALAAEIQEFMDTSGDGVVVFSLGNLVRTVPLEIANKLASGFSRLPERVIWRHTGETPSTLGNNTKILSWLPQNDLLSHPKTKAFISHGGENGLYEAIYHGVPVIGFPLFGDQYENILRLKSRGAAFLLENLAEFTAEDIYTAVRTVIDDPSYRANMQRLSALHRDVQVHPMQTAIFWIEYTIRHKGASHLQAAGNDLPFYQYYLLDVIGLLGAVLFLFLVLVWKIFKTFVKKVCSWKRNLKQEKRAAAKKNK